MPPFECGAALGGLGSILPFAASAKSFGVSMSVVRDKPAVGEKFPRSKLTAIADIGAFSDKCQTQNFALPMTRTFGWWIAAIFVSSKSVHTTY